MMTSQESQPSCCISSRDMGRNGATPKRAAQYLRYEVRSLATADIEQLQRNGVGVAPSRKEDSGHIYMCRRGARIAPGLTPANTIPEYSGNPRVGHPSAGRAWPGAGCAAV